MNFVIVLNHKNKPVFSDEVITTIKESDKFILECYHGGEILIDKSIICDILSKYFEIRALKKLAVPCDNNTRYKIDKPNFDEIINNLLKE